jgi:hypothetical protein
VTSITVSHNKAVSAILALSACTGFERFPAGQLMGLRHFLAPLEAENTSGQGKEVNDLKIPKTLITTGFMPIRAKSFSPSSFEAIFCSIFV